MKNCYCAVLASSDDSPAIPALACNIELAAIFYDLDGTLASTDPLHYGVWWELLRQYGITIDEAFYKTRISGRTNPEIIHDLLPQLSDEAGQQLADKKEATFRELAPQLTPLPGLIQVLEWAAARKLKQAVVTNAPTENVHHMLKALKLDSVFDLVVISEAIGLGKPDPAPYLHALQQFGLAPDRVLAFEDSPSGLRSAVGAGIPTVGIASTQEPEVLYAIGAHLVVPDFTSDALWNLLEQRSSGA